MEQTIQGVEVAGDRRLGLRWRDGASEIEFEFPIRTHGSFLHELKSASEFRAVELDERTNDLKWPCGVRLGGSLLRTWTLKSKAKAETLARVAHDQAYKEQHGEYPRKPPDDSMQAYSLYLRQLIPIDHLQIPRPPTRFRDPHEARVQLQRAIGAKGTASFEAGQAYTRHFLQGDAKRFLDAERSADACAILREAALVYGDEMSAGALAREMLKAPAAVRDVVGARHLLEIAALAFYDETTDLYARACLAEMYLTGKGGLDASEDRAIRLYVDLDSSPENGDNLTIAWTALSWAPPGRQVW
jgi:hypothetical protein